jgi:integrase
MATVQYYQALRISEVAALFWEDLFFDWDEPHRSRLTVRRKIYWPRKAGIASEIKEGFKNADSGDNQGVKEQPLFPESYEALMRIFKSGSKGLIFKMNDSHFEYRILQKRYDRAFERAGLPHRGTHIMRHGGCSRLFDERGDLGVAKQILGNSSLRSVEVYARRSKRALSDVAQKHWERRGLQAVTGGNGECSEKDLRPETGN